MSDKRPAFSPDRVMLMFLLCGLLLAFGGSARAQSGRRAPKQEPPPPPVPSAPVDPRASKPPASKPAAPVMELIVGQNKFSAMMDLPLSYNRYVYEACIARLRQSSALSVTPSGDLTRKEAIDRAKIQREAYVVWLDLAVDGFNSSAADVSLGSPRGRYYVDFVVFSPQTAKVKLFGRVFLDTVRVGSGRVGIGVPSISRRLPIEYSLQYAGAEAADRVMSAFHLPLPDGP